ncbi:penicillin-binding protein 2 [Patescibacteria group bacterium]|nr:penicillin-binding protein 2 [Patescibacteria group bacterium]
MIRGSILFRVRILTALLLAVAVLLIVRLYLVQVSNGKEYAEKAEGQYVGSVKNIFDRGTIYFTTKDGERVSAATLKVGYTVAINPDFIEDAEKTYQALNAIVSIDKEDFLKRAEKKGDPYEEIAKRVSEKDAEKIRALSLKGIQLYRDQWRYYPGDELLSRTIGFVAYKEDTLGGRYGLERSYEEVLSRDSDNLFVNFFAEIFENFGSVVFDSGENKEGHIVTTLEPSVARALESNLKSAHDTYQSKETGGIVINPQTGAIYAMSVYPGFNLNDFSEVTDPRVFNNPLVEQVHEMGSIIKPLTVAAGLDAGAITPESTYYDPGFLEMSGYTIYNFDKKGRGQVSMQEVLNQSLNTGVAHIVKTMGRSSFRAYFKALAFDQKTGIDLPGETSGLTANLESPRDLEYATASFGQGIAMTPLETVRALSALGNGGELITPHLVTDIMYDSGGEKKVEFGAPTRVFSEKTSEEISRMLVEVVDTALAGGKEKMDRYTIAAKTGTAQIALPNGKGYYDDRYLHSFFGYFPAFDPKFLVFLYTVEPQNVEYASQTLTRPFMDLAKFLLNYYDVPPDR